MADKVLYRSTKNKVIWGVCGGIGEYSNIDPTIVRLALILFTLMGGAGILFYIIAYFLIPQNTSKR